MKFFCAKVLLFALLLNLSTTLLAQTPLSEVDLGQIQRIQEEQLERAKAQLQNPDSIRSQLPSLNNLMLSQDGAGRCFPIQQARLLQVSEQGTEKTLDTQWGWLAEYLAPVSGQCLGVAQIQSLQKQLNQALISQGYITTKIAIPEQNLQSGILQLTLIPGRVTDLVPDESAIGYLPMAFGGNPDLYQQHQVDQALEQIRRLSGQSQATLEVKPSETLGGSNIVLNSQTQKRIHGVITVDNTGGGASKEFNWSGSVMIDSPFYLYDSLNFSMNTDPDIFNPDNYSRSANLSWSVPYGRLLFTVDGGLSEYKQTAQGAFQDIIYDGESHHYGFGVNYVAHRDADSKTEMNLNLNRRVSHNYVNEVEIDSQHRDIVSTSLGLHHTQYLENGQLSSGINYHQSIPQWSLAPDIIAGQPKWDGQYRKLTVQANYNRPVKIFGHDLHWQSEFSGQVNLNKEIPTGQLMTLGSRGSLRGFDETYSIRGENGIAWQNTLSMPLNAQHQAYVGLDMGQVYGNGTVQDGQDYMIGATAGINGQFDQLNYQVGLGYPISASNHIRSDKTNVYGQVSYRF